jgi:(1->4)-alpha-D-glucan 1-alpha-D-glucosylmutase
VRVRIPQSTYRIQFNAEFGFADAVAVVPYLARLGVGDIYASPSLTARPGSPHGYDVADPSRVSRELGGARGLIELSQTLRAHSMGLLLDIVPNHMAASTDNPWWADLLEHGRQSQYAHFFDIDWEPTAGAGAVHEKILLPVLGQVYGAELESGQITLDAEEDGFVVRYHDLTLPVSPRSWPRIRDAGSTRQERLATINGIAGRPETFDRLHSILEEQAYRLAYWRRAADEINYRRFFDISDLVGVRVELEEVFLARHALIMRLIREGVVTGLRIDHIDGLYDPAEYLERLRTLAAPDCYVVVEKILAEDERLRDGLAAHGTSGYDYLASVNLVFIDPAGLERLDRFYRRTTGLGEWDRLVYEKKKLVLEELFWGTLRRLGDDLVAMARVDRYARDVRARQITRALVEITACLGVYRTYIRDVVVSPQDRRRIERAVARAREIPMLSSRAIDFVRSALLLEYPPYAEDRKDEWLSFVMRWQQLTGPVMAKGVEDTSFYIYNRLISMNEVGGDPAVDVSQAVAQFHRGNAERAARWPHALNGTSTHDTKRSEDVRARIHVISELAGAWQSAVGRWMRMNARHKRAVQGRMVPDPNEEMLIYQTLAGVWPLNADEIGEVPDRLEQFLIKAARESKQYTTWLRPDEAYEAALTGFARRILRRSNARFLDDFLRLQARIAHHGCLNSLAQVTLKATSPGVPDFYRGSELWDFSLVDPDNRRPVDYALRQALLESVETADVSEMLDGWRDGRIKLFTTTRLLQLRRRRAEFFQTADYQPLTVRGPQRAHVVGFARRSGRQWMVTVTPRLVANLSPPGRLPLGAKVWTSTTLVLPSGAPVRWKNIFTDKVVAARRRGLALGEVFAECPVAVCVGE